MKAAMIEILPFFFLALLSLVEIVPIKLNPLSRLLKWMGEQLNGSIQRELQEIKRDVDQNEIDRIRWEILDFANGCRNHCHHSKEEFHHIVELNEKYHKLIQRNHLTNGVLDREYAYIEKIYEACLQKDTL